MRCRGMPRWGYVADGSMVADGEAVQSMTYRTIHDDDHLSAHRKKQCRDAEADVIIQLTRAAGLSESDVRRVRQTQ